MQISCRIALKAQQDRKPSVQDALLASIWRTGGGLTVRVSAAQRQNDPKKALGPE